MKLSCIATLLLACLLGIYSVLADDDCEKGEYRNRGDCKDCPRGTYMPKDDHKYRSCWNCQKGKFQDLKGQDECENCAPGKYQNQTGATSCISCQTGKYQSTPGGLSPCSTCPDGQTANAIQTGCDDCGRGTAGRNGFCNRCSLGKYQNQEGATDCKSCGDGKTSTENRHDCASCGKGSAGKDGICWVCPAGTYSDEEELAACKPVGPGYYSHAAGSQIKVPCDPGTAQNQNIASMCALCQPGYFQQAYAKPTCQAVVIGTTFTSSTGATEPYFTSTCNPGRYMTDSATATSDRKCADCPPGKHQPEENIATSCITCSQFTVPNNARTSCVFEASSCQAGFYVASGNECKNCSEGTFTTSQGQAECTAHRTCRAGFRQTKVPIPTSNRECKRCGAGEFSNSSNSLDCQSCAVGTYQPSPGQTGCLDHSPICPAGSKQTQSPTSVQDRICVTCDPGQNLYQPNVGASNCLEASFCDAGQYVAASPATTSNRVCASCELGVTYQDEVNRPTCKPVKNCQPGFEQFSSPTLSTDRICSECQSGWYNLGGELQCLPASICPAGSRETQAATTTVNTVCRDCGSNSYQPEVGKDFCFNATVCNNNQWTTKELTTTSDRECTTIKECNSGVDQNSQACTCMTNSCSSCTQAMDGSGHLLFRVDQSPEMTQLGQKLVSQLGRLATDSSYVSECSEKCATSSGCTGFFVFDKTLTTNLRGDCFLASSFNTERIIPRVGGSFYQLESCRVCQPGFVIAGLSCQAMDQLPIWSNIPNTLTVAERADAGISTSFAAIPRTVSEENLAIRYSLEDVRRSGGDAAVFSIDTTSGSLSTVGPLVGPGVALLVLRAIDNRSSCRTATLTVLDGGCYVEITVRVVVVGFLQSCTSIVYYLPASEDNVTLSLATPELPTIATQLGVLVHRSGAVGTTFGVGKFNVTFQTSKLDIGSVPVCRYGIEVLRGVTANAQAIGHANFLDAGLSQDYILEKQARVRGQVMAPVFSTQDILAEDFAYGIRGPNEDTPFSVTMPKAVSAKMIVYLLWCQPGKSFAASDIVNTSANIILTGNGDQLVFKDTGSGITQGNECMRISLESQVFTSSQSFASINLLLPLKQLGARRRRALSTFVPDDASVVMVQYIGSTSDPDLAAKLGQANLQLADTIPPHFTGCPLEPVQAVADVSRGLITSVSWQPPQAVDNVGMSQVLASHTPGANFSVDGSPHLITYTAVDIAGLRTVCNFDVVVRYIPQVYTVAATLDDSFTMETVTKSLIPSVFERYALMDPALRMLSFAGVDLTGYTGLQFDIATLSTDPVELRALPEVRSFQFAFDLKWNTEFTLSEAEDSRVDVAISFKDYVLTPGQDPDCIPLSSAHTVYGALAGLDPLVGKMSASGKTAVFSCGFTFSAIHFKIDFPYITSFSTGTNFQYDADPSNEFYVEVARSKASIDAGSYLAAVIMKDTQTPVIENGPSSTLLKTGSTAKGTASWPISTVTDNRDYTLQLYAYLGSSQRILIGSEASNVSVGPLVVEFYQLNGLQYIKVPVQLPKAAALQLLYVARDPYGLEATHNFEVAVRDDFQPALELIDAELFVNLTQGAEQAIVNRNKLIGVVSDNAPFNVTIVSPTNQADAYRVGATPVSVTVEDAWGNRATRTITVVVEDHEKPTASCLPNIIVPAETEAGANATWGSMPVSDNTDPRGSTLRIVASHQPGSFFPVGDTAVSMTVFDASNNTVGCNFTVKVNALATSVSSTANDSTSTLGAGAGAGVLLLVASVLAFFMYRARQRARQPADWDQIFAMIDQLKNTDDAVSRPREIARSSMTLLEELGKGAFGIVYKGLLEEAPNPSFLVAVKSLHPTAGGTDRQELLEEAAVMCQFKHINIVRLVGVVTVGKPLCKICEPKNTNQSSSYYIAAVVVLEYCEKGNVKDYVESHNTSIKQRLLFAMDAARGLKYIHSKHFVHRDIAARNVLLDSMLRGKISDFGLARDEGEGEEAYYRSRSGNIPVRWTAPEGLEERRFSEKTDVWAAGVFMYEIWTKAMLPYDGWHNQKVWIEVSAGYRLAKPDGCLNDIYELMLDCWSPKPEDRPDFTKLVGEIEDLLRMHCDWEADNGYLDIEAIPAMPKRGSLLKRMLSRSSDSGSRQASTSKNAGETKHGNKDAFYDMGTSPANTGLYDLGENDEMETQTMPVIETVVTSASLMHQHDGEQEFGFDDENGGHNLHDNDNLYGNSDGILRSPVHQAGALQLALGEEHVGCRVSVEGYSVTGTLRYFGRHSTKPGIRCGVELDAPVGLNNGTIKGHRYFDCPEKHGVLVVPAKVTVLDVLEVFDARALPKA